MGATEIVLDQAKELLIVSLSQHNTKVSEASDHPNYSLNCIKPTYLLITQFGQSY